MARWNCCKSSIARLPDDARDVGFEGADSSVAQCHFSANRRVLGVLNVTAIAISLSENGPITSECRAELVLAATRGKKIHRAASVAAFNGWLTGFFAACSAPFAVFSISGFLVTAGLILVAYNEFRGRKRLLQFDPNAAAWLGWNQVGFLALITIYSAWMIGVGLSSAGPFAAEAAANPELAATIGSLHEFDALYRFLVVTMYGLVIFLSAIFQGLNAGYYFTRRKHVVAYVRETPAWVLDLQRVAQS